MSIAGCTGLDDTPNDSARDGLPLASPKSVGGLQHVVVMHLEFVAFSAPVIVSR